MVEKRDEMPDFGLLIVEKIAVALWTLLDRGNILLQDSTHKGPKLAGPSTGYCLLISGRYQVYTENLI